MMSLEGKKICIVEDEPWFAESVTRTLESAGVETVIASNAQSAIEQIDEFFPDAVVLDLLLAGSTGLVLLHELRSHDDLASLPVIICSTLIDQPTSERLRAYGVQRVLDKTTMQPDDILAALRGVLA